jgi:xanthine dehydrogenase molybdopterin-binding subunit B
MTHVSTRRSLLKAGGSLVVGFSLGVRLPLASAQPVAAHAKPVALDEVDSYLAIGPDGRVTVFSGKVDLGTGVRTALTQMAADELDLGMDRVTVVQGDTLLTPDQGPTYGSLSIQSGGAQIRQAAATARKHLVAAAAQKLGVPESDLTVTDGVVRPKGGGAGVSYGELVGGGDFKLKLDKDVTTKNPAAFTLVGKPIARLDIPAKTTGRFTYMHDHRVDGMLHARVVRPSAIGADLRDVDLSSVQAIPGLVKVVRQGNFLGVVAESEWGAIRAAQTLKATWSDWQGLPEQSKLWEHVRGTKVTKDDVTSQVGNTGEAMGKGERTLSATYDFPIHTHGSIGPSCAIADFRDGKLTV